MNIVEILDYVRVEILDDTVGPNYLWPDKQLVRHLNRAYEELCRESQCLIDSALQSDYTGTIFSGVAGEFMGPHKASKHDVCYIDLIGGDQYRPMHAKIVKIFEATRLSDGAFIPLKSEQQMGGYSNWRSQTGSKPQILVVNTQNRRVTVYPKLEDPEWGEYPSGALPFDTVHYDATNKCITVAGVDWSDHYGSFLVNWWTDELTNKIICRTGSIYGNDGTYSVIGYEPGYENRIYVLEDVTEEYVYPNYVDCLFPMAERILMRVARLPLTPWTESDLTAATIPSPEIDSTYHMGLADGIAKFAFLKQDTQTYDPKKAADHKKAFEDFKSDVRWDIQNLMEGDSICQPHYGAL